MYSYSIKKLLDLEEVIVKKIIHADYFVKIFIEAKPSSHICPNCEEQTKRIHDYQSQEIKDLPLQLKHTILVLRKQRYLCTCCGKKFMEIYDFDRTQAHLCEYFHSTPKSKPNRVKFFLCDIWTPYVELAKAFFPNELYNDDLRQTHRLKEAFYNICQHEKYSYQRTAFWEWIKEAESSRIPEFEKCAKTYRTWSRFILNAFKYKYTNGSTEGFNNKIKVLKRSSYGVKNFKRFRTRILHSTI